MLFAVIKAVSLAALNCTDKLIMGGGVVFTMILPIALHPDMESETVTSSVSAVFTQIFSLVAPFDHK